MNKQFPWASPIIEIFIRFQLMSKIFILIVTDILFAHVSNNCRLLTKEEYRKYKG